MSLTVIEADCLHVKCSNEPKHVHEQSHIGWGRKKKNLRWCGRSLPRVESLCHFHHHTLVVSCGKTYRYLERAVSCHGAHHVLSLYYTSMHVSYNIQYQYDCWHLKTILAIIQSCIWRCWALREVCWGRKWHCFLQFLQEHSSIPWKTNKNACQVCFVMSAPTPSFSFCWILKSLGLYVWMFQHKLVCCPKSYYGSRELLIIQTISWGPLELELSKACCTQKIEKYF